RCRINQTCVQGREDTPGMQGGHVSLPVSYLDVEDAAVELTTRDQLDGLLWTTGSLVAYGRRDHLRWHDFEASPRELRTRICRQDISDRDAPRTSGIRVSPKRGAFDQQRVTCTVVWWEHGDRLVCGWQRWDNGRMGAVQCKYW